MAEFSQFWTTSPDGTGTGDGASEYNRLQIRNWLSDTFGDGVIPGVRSELAVSASGNTLQAGAGAGYVAGLFYMSDAAVSQTVTTPLNGTTGFRYVLRADWTAQTVRQKLSMSPDGTNAPPALQTSEGSLYEFPLASGSITTGGQITLADERAFADPRIPLSHIIGAMIAPNTIGVREIAPSGVGTSELADDSISQDKMQTSSIGPGQLQPGAVVTNAIQDEAVTGPKLAPGSATDDKIGNRTLDDTLAPVNSGGMRNLMSGLANVIKGITGRSDWTLPANVSLETLRSRFFSNGHDHSGADPDGPKLDIKAALIQEVADLRVTYADVGGNTGLPLLILQTAQPGGTHPNGSIWIQTGVGFEGQVWVKKSNIWKRMGNSA